MARIIAAALSLALLALARGDHPVDWEREFSDNSVETRDAVFRNAETYRLPTNVVPLEYDIYIDLYFDERTDRPFSYDGRESIIIQAVEENVSQITLHANVDSINSISVLSSEDTPVLLNIWNPYEIEPLSHFLRINLAQPLLVQTNYTLQIEYSSTMNEGPMKRGIWRGWYEDANGVTRVYATTHFQPYNARQAFPCWDEPLFKSIFKLHLSRPSSYNGVFSNTAVESLNVLENRRVQEHFMATPAMSSYLVTFLVSETMQVIAEDTSFSPPIRIIGRSNAVGLANYSLELAVGMTEHFDEYFQFPYADLHPNLQNDHIASPDWASAGTENWGMVSYRELYLILDPRETIMSVEHYAATLVSHELAHKWFGNYITCYWWSNTWINEGFASYFGYMATHQVFPRLELNDHFNSRYLQTSLSFDSGAGTVPLNHEVNSPAQVTGHFGTISYSKGAAFLRMTANIITPATFQKACQYFLRQNPFAATDQYDLLRAFEDAIVEDGSLSGYSNFNFSDYYRIWVNEPGYPILNVDIQHSTGVMSLRQERFFLSGAAPTGQIYPIPITYSTARNPNFSNLRPTQMMSEATLELRKDPGSEWVIFNNWQHGHYRVNYDSVTWNLIADALVSDIESIHYLNRAQIVDDVFALMRSGRMTYNFGFNVLRFLRFETNFHVWEPAISGYTWIRNRLRHVPESRVAFDAFLLSYLENVIEEVGFEPEDEETPTVSLVRQSVLHFACNLGHVQCVEESQARFLRMRDGQWIDPKIRRNVYVSGIREGGEIDFNFLVARFSQSNFANDQLEMLRGLGATRSPALLNRYLQMTLTRVVRSHDKVNSFNYALLGNQENANTVLQFVQNNIDAIRVEYVEDSPANPVNTALSNLASYLDESDLVVYENWLRSTQSNSAQFNGAINSINSARNNIQWARDNADIIIQAARDGATTVVTSTIMMIGLVVLALNV